MLSEEQLRWYVGRTPANVEVRMRDYFAGRGIESFVPTATRLSRHAGRVLEREYALIPNLVFFRTCKENAISLFNACGRTMYSLVDRTKPRREILTVADSQMEPFIRFVRENKDRVRILHEALEVGDSVMIKNGPLAGMVGVITIVGGQEQFTLRLDGLLYAVVHYPKSDLIRFDGSATLGAGLR